MVKTFLADGAHESLRVRVGFWRAHRSADGLDSDRSEHRVKADGELGVPVTDEEPETPTFIFEIGGEVPGDLGHPRVSFGLVVTPRTWTTRRSSSITNNT